MVISSVEKDKEGEEHRCCCKCGRRGDGVEDVVILNSMVKGGLTKVILS